ncbi:hypothetical protein WG66_002130, partial [Moniliophthora roreri]
MNHRIPQTSSQQQRTNYVLRFDISICSHRDKEYLPSRMCF